MMRILVLNGPNLDMLGRRQPEIYGDTSLAQLDEMVGRWGANLGVEVETIQSNSEELLIEAVHRFDGEGIVFNPGAFTHTSRALADAIAAVDTPVVEVHISNVTAREPWRASSVIADSCVHTIYGRGVAGYRDALRHLVNRQAWPAETIRYGPHPDNLGDLRGAGRGLVLLVHGGLWRGEYQRDLMDSLAVDLAQRGIASWNIEYRRTGRGGGWPGSAHDVLTALDHARRLGSGRIVAVGHSAGSQLLMWAASRTITPVGLHVALAPILDLERAVADSTVAASDCTLLLQQGAPTRTSPAGVETVIVHGKADQVVPADHSREIATTEEIELHLTETDHFSLLDPAKPEWSWVMQRMEGHL